jgi:salicylate hydroxylase
LEESLEVKVKAFSGGSLSWIYELDIKDVWEEYVKTHEID